MSAGVLDLRERVHRWRWRAAETTTTPKASANRHSLYDAILRDGMVVIEGRLDPDPEHPFWTPLGTFSRRDLERLRGLIDEALGAANSHSRSAQ